MLALFIKIIDIAKHQMRFLHYGNLCNLFLAKSHVSVSFSWPLFCRLELNLLCIIIENISIVDDDFDDGNDIVEAGHVDL